MWRYVLIGLAVLGIGFHVAAAQIDTTHRSCDLSLPLDPGEAARKEAACQRFLADGRADVLRRDRFETAGNVFLALGAVAVAGVFIRTRGPQPPNR